MSDHARGSSCLPAHCLLDCRHPVHLMNASLDPPAKRSHLPLQERAQEKERKRDLKEKERERKRRRDSSSASSQHHP